MRYGEITSGMRRRAQSHRMVPKEVVYHDAMEVISAPGPRKPHMVRG